MYGDVSHMLCEGDSPGSMYVLMNASTRVASLRVANIDCGRRDRQMTITLRRIFERGIFVEPRRMAGGTGKAGQVISTEGIVKTRVRVERMTMNDLNMAEPRSCANITC